MVNLIDTINVTIEKMGIKFDLIEPKILEHLKKVEQVISEKFSIQEDIQNNIKNNRLSINNIASDSNIARQTIYNNELLKSYIEIRINSYNQFDPGKKNDKLLEQISVLEKMIKKMTERDVQLELTRRKLALVENELKLLKKENIELHQRYNNLKQDKRTKEKTVSVAVFNQKK
ncbi:hypothetical protein [Psychrobacillus sp. MER TA 171]|uniref:hypothetical protein n=1 Tax=Psychrobacillus sp. MER TA 171 TaxID=2939577 RepID=UPI002041525E|nr:hypothetical protein [Psychrobacillus sp. MER TA 171]MCM3359532.1 hypothetical protein [Psychrobacillus sp. MER TA 171]